MAASISGSRTCYPSAAVPRGSRRNVVRSSFPPCSPASKPSTTLSIGGKWPELQGSRDWDGLLTPLDGALRGELLRYGEFVRAAYASFDFDGGAPSYGSCRFPSRSLLRRAGLPETGYQVTRLLHAASTSAPAWLSPSSNSSYIGYVAVCDDDDEIHRLGRRDVVVAYRGTATCSEWLDNFKSGLTRLPSSPTLFAGDDDDEAMVESGFWKLFTAPGEAHSSLQQQVRDEVRRIIHEYGGEGMPPLSITVTGHSLGAALAVLSAYEITTAIAGDDDDAPAPMVTAVSFGGPRVGNAAFRRRLEESGGKVLRVVNSSDVVTKVPGFPVDAKRKAARVPRWLVSKMGWEYSDVGSELTLSSDDSVPNVVASHDLDLYIRLQLAARQLVEPMGEVENVRTLGIHRTRPPLFPDTNLGEVREAHRRLWMEAQKVSTTASGKSRDGGAGTQDDNLRCHKPPARPSCARGSLRGPYRAMVAVTPTPTKPSWPPHRHLGRRPHHPRSRHLRAGWPATPNLFFGPQPQTSPELKKNLAAAVVRCSSLEPWSPLLTMPSTLKIGRKWPELQGARDWDGLLTPLDGALRGELLRYGEFVRAAYASFDFDGRAPSYGSCRFPSRSLLRRAGLPETGYQVTRLLHAASSASPPFSSSSSSYIGYVAVCDDEDEIRRLGRRDVVIAYRGTVTWSEWVDSFRSNLTRLPPTWSDVGGEEEESPAMVQSGFWSLFTTPGEAHGSLGQQVRDEVRRIFREYGGGKGTPPASITIAGHSLGAALAVLSAYEITTIAGDDPPMVMAVSFGGPRVGNAAFRRRLEESGGKVLRVVNSSDVVTKIPGFAVDDDDDSGGEAAELMARVPRWLASKMGWWAYSDVGRELRLSSDDSAAPNVVASHDLDLGAHPWRHHRGELVYRGSRRRELSDVLTQGGGAKERAQQQEEERHSRKRRGRGGGGASRRPCVLPPVRSIEDEAEEDDGLRGKKEAGVNPPAEFGWFGRSSFEFREVVDFVVVQLNSTTSMLATHPWQHGEPDKLEMTNRYPCVALGYCVRFKDTKAILYSPSLPSPGDMWISTHQRGRCPRLLPASSGDDWTSNSVVRVDARSPGAHLCHVGSSVAETLDRVRELGARSPGAHPLDLGAKAPGAHLPDFKRAAAPFFFFLSSLSFLSSLFQTVAGAGAPTPAGPLRRRRRPPPPPSSKGAR
nr:unnamed protein product [Digitaria exilis]